MNDLALTDDSMLDLLARTAQNSKNAAAIHFFGRTLSWSEVDDITDSLATGLINHGVASGDRIGLLMQNVPQYMLSLVAIWKAGAVAVPINPMLTPKDVRFIVNDSDASALIGLDSLVERLVSDDSVEAFPALLVVTTTADEYATAWPEVLTLPRPSTVPHSIEWGRLLGDAGGPRPFPPVTADQPAVLTYTSGTTGPPKGAVNTHANVVFASRFYEQWAKLDQADVVLGIAPLFHITGLVAHIGPSIVTGAALVLGYRFEVNLIADLIEQYRPTFTIGAITAFIALMTDPVVKGRDLSSLTTVYSGGAPIAPTTVEDFERTFGPYIHNIYGLTEATGPCLAVPLGARAPVDPTTGALAAGIPVCNTEVKIVREDGTAAPRGEPGELAMRGPQVVPGYWRRDAETANAIRDGWLYTGDVAVQDDAGWFYIVDRLKDQINASGFKVWPREVEDALVSHPDVVEAAVVGVPDEYRGETVKAFVVLTTGSAVSPEELIRFSRERLAAYKYPRFVEIVDELPHTASGKILRRALRST